MRAGPAALRMTWMSCRIKNRRGAAMVAIRPRPLVTSLTPAARVRWTRYTGDEPPLSRNLTSMRFVRPASVLALTCLAACGGKTSAESSDAAPSDATTTPTSCSWSSSFDAIDAEPMRDSCRAARSLLSCTGSDGTSTFCITDKAKCDPPTRPGVSYTCKSVCKPTEFGAICGNAMGSSVVPPADCPLQIPSTGGVFHCCTCSM